VQTIGAPAPEAPRIDVPGTLIVAKEHTHVRHDSWFSATIYQWLSAVTGIVFQSPTVEAIRGPCLKLLLLIFLGQKLDRTFSSNISKKRACSNFDRMSFGAPLLAGGPTHVRTVLNGQSGHADYIRRQRDRGQADAKTSRPRSRPRPKFWPRGHFGLENLTSPATTKCCTTVRQRDITSYITTLSYYGI